MNKLLVLGALLLLMVGCKETGNSSLADDAVNTATSTSTTARGFSYSFDGIGSTIIDGSGNNYNGTATALARVPGISGQAIQFLGTGSKIEVRSPKLAFPNAPSFTVMTWIKTSGDFIAREQIIGGWTGGSPGSFYPINNYGVSMINNQISFEIAVYPSMGFVTSSTLPIALNTWFHVAVTYDGSNVAFYFNGQLDSQTSLLSSPSSQFNNQIGHDYHVFGGVQVVNQFYGILDELAVIPRVLTSTEILDHYTQI